MNASPKALLVIDLQNDYFPEGKFPLWDTEATLINIETAIAKASAQGIHIIHIQHIANGASPFFNNGTDGVKIHPRILAAAPDAHVVIKAHADSFFETSLESTLSQLGVTALFICGMMTQNCVTHTAISKSAEKYTVSILADCCTTTNEAIHRFALSAISTRLHLLNSTDAF